MILFVNVENQNLYKPSSCHEPAQEIMKNGKHWYLYFVNVSADKHIDICLVGEAVLPITIGQKASLCCFDTFILLLSAVIAIEQLWQFVMTLNMTFVVQCAICYKSDCCPRVLTVVLDEDRLSLFLGIFLSCYMPCTELLPLGM